MQHVQLFNATLQSTDLSANTGLGQLALHNTQITSLTLPAGVQQMGLNLYDTPQLTSLTLPVSGHFDYCHITNAPSLTTLDLSNCYINSLLVRQAPGLSSIQYDA